VLTSPHGVGERQVRRRRRREETEELRLGFGGGSTGSLYRGAACAWSRGAIGLGVPIRIGSASCVTARAAGPQV
jgi:hypothetical protein